VNEACAAGLPILCSRTVGACPELVQPHQNGLVFAPEDEGAIAQCLTQFHQLDPATRRQWGQHSQQMVARFSPTVFAGGLLQAIDSSSVGKA
jgi:glycosyltransferase involved in cell wall biosynthesis